MKKRLDLTDMHLKLYIMFLVNAEVEMKLLVDFLGPFTLPKAAWMVHTAKLVLQMTALLCAVCVTASSIPSHAKPC